MLNSLFDSLSWKDPKLIFEQYIIGMNRANELDNQRRRDYQRNLTNPQSKYKYRTHKVASSKQRQFPKSMVLNVSAQQFQPADSSPRKAQESNKLVKVEDLPILLSRMVIKKNVRFFVNKLKRSLHHKKMLQRCTNFGEDLIQERLARNPEKDKAFSFLNLQGLSFSEKANLTLQLVTFSSFFYINLLSTFECFLQEFRQNQSQEIWVQASELTCLLIIFVKVLCNCVIQTNINGIKQTKIFNITKSFLFSANSIIDLILIIAIILMLKIKHRIQPAVIAYIMSLIRIAISDRIDDSVAKHLLLSNHTKQYYSLIRLLLANFFFAHLFGSIFLALSTLEDGYSWIYKYDFYADSWFAQYVYSVYWATTIMTTVGFGDITPTSYVQAIVVTVVMLIGCLILSYIAKQLQNVREYFKMTQVCYIHKFIV